MGSDKSSSEDRAASSAIIGGGSAPSAEPGGEKLSIVEQRRSTDGVALSKLSFFDLDLDFDFDFLNLAPNDIDIPELLHLGFGAELHNIIIGAAWGRIAHLALL